MKKSTKPKTSLFWWAGALALLIAGFHVLQENGAEKSDLRQSLGGSLYKFTPWTADQEISAGDACRRSVASKFSSYDSRRDCFARSYCSCATRNYQARQTSYTEFMDMLYGITSYAVPGKSGYFCTSTAESDCPEPRKKEAEDRED